MILYHVGFIEFLGLLAGLFVMTSFLIKSELIMRIVNSIGVILFAIYGIIIGAWAIWVVNIALLIIHVVFLLRNPSKQKNAEVKK